MHSRALALVLAAAALASACGGAAGLANQTKLSIGTAEGIFDVVDAGRVQPAWSNFRDANATTIPAAHDSFVLEMVLINGTEAQPFSVTSLADDNQAVVFLNGVSELNASVQTDASTDLQVLVQCLEETTVEVSLTFALEGFNPVTVEFNKVCTTPAVSHQLDVGTMNGTDDVVSAGVVKAAWANFTDDDCVTIDAEYDELFFNLHLGTAGVDESLSFEMTSVFDEDMLTVSLDKGASTAGKVEKGQDLELHVSLACHDEGVAHVRLDVVLVHYKPLAIEFRKACANTRQHKAEFLQVGRSSNGAADVVVNGTSTGADLVSRQETDLDVFYVWSNGAGGNVRPRFHLLGGIEAHPHGVVDAVASCGLCRAFEYDPADPANVDRLEVHYACSPMPSAEKANLTMRLVAEGAAEPTVIQWTRYCPFDANGGGGGGGGGGWSGVGIFFFVVFILTLVAFLGGCAFKYFKMGRRGLDVVPLIDTCRRCAPGPATVSPQDDYSELDSTRGSSYGAVDYQNNL